MQQQVQQDLTATALWLMSAQSSAELQGFPQFKCDYRHLSFRIALDAVCFGERVFKFHDPIELRLDQDDNVWTCQACGILSVGSDPTGAAMSFCEDFAMCWDHIAQADDESLSEDAQETKKCMLSVVKSIR